MPQSNRSRNAEGFEDQSKSHRKRRVEQDQVPDEGRKSGPGEARSNQGGERNVRSIKGDEGGGSELW